MLDVLRKTQKWHEKKVHNLRYVQDNAKEGTKLAIGESDPLPTPMTDRDAVFFRLGMEAVLVELGTLPFTIGKEDGQ